MSVQSDLVQVPEVMEDESGGEFYAAGHVEPALFLLGLLVSHALNVGDQEAFDLLGDARGPRGWRTGLHESATKLLTEVKHVWFGTTGCPKTTSTWPFVSRPTTGPSRSPGSASDERRRA